MISTLLTTALSYWHWTASQVYDTVIVTPLTKAIYEEESARLLDKYGRRGFTLLDVGAATGTTLKVILDTPGLNINHATALDIDQTYIDACRVNTAQYREVNVVKADFMSEGMQLDRQYDTILFGFSFMFMTANYEQTFKVIRSKLRPAGEVVIYLTLYDEANSLLDFIKPKIKYLTSIDFGPSVYKADLFDAFKNHGFDVLEVDRMQGNGSMLLKTFGVHRIVIKPK